MVAARAQPAYVDGYLTSRHSTRADASTCLQPHSAGSSCDMTNLGIYVKERGRWWGVATSCFLLRFISMLPASAGARSVVDSIYLDRVLVCVCLRCAMHTPQYALSASRYVPSWTRVS